MQCIVDGQDEETRARTAIAQLLPELRAAARLLTTSRAEADDLVQEAVLRMLRGLPGFVPGPEHGDDLRAAMRPWGVAVLRNTFREGWRRARRERAHQEETSGDEGRAGGEEATHQLHDLSRAMAKLPPALREALVLVGAQGLSHEEAARVCDVPVGTMKARVSRARAALARALDPVTS
jgi:RNA polymerase sigma-70 factor (ECF subfamily)